MVHSNLHPIESLHITGRVTDVSSDLVLPPVYPISLPQLFRKRSVP